MNSNSCVPHTILEVQFEVYVLQNKGVQISELVVWLCFLFNSWLFL